MIGRGTYEFKVGDKTIGFKFNMYASSLTEEQLGQPISELFKLQEDQEGNKSVKVKSLLAYFYGGYVSYCHANRSEAEPLAIFSDFLEEIGQGPLMDMYSKSLGVYSKNVEAPTEGQVKISA
jgi:hypothetical protein